jgi:hypothetical protein
MVKPGMCKVGYTGRGFCREVAAEHTSGDFRSGCTAGVFEGVAAFSRLKAVECSTDELPQTFAGPLGGFVQRRFKFGEGLLDGIELKEVR